MGVFDLLGDRGMVRKVAVVVAIPDQHGAGAIFGLGDHVIEVGIGQGMILGGNCQVLALRIGGGALGHGPGLQNAINVEADIVVQGGGGVLLDDEVWPLAWFAISHGLRGAARVALLSIAGQSVAGCGH